MRYNKYLSLTLIFLFVFCGCYTQLLTYRDYESAVRKDMAVTDSSGVKDTVYVNQNESGISCTPYEIQHGTCWTVCDRCGYYHQFGYEYCPVGMYHSYWGWDYYDYYPWWSDRYHRYHGDSYYNRNRYYDHNDYYHNYGSPSSGQSNISQQKEKPKKHRGMVEQESSTINTLNKPLFENPNSSIQINVPTQTSPPSSKPSATESKGNESQPPPSKPVQPDINGKQHKHRGQVNE